MEPTTSSCNFASMIKGIAPIVTSISVKEDIAFLEHLAMELIHSKHSQIDGGEKRYNQNDECLPLDGLQ